jgi:hypothetical protein
VNWNYLIFGSIKDGGFLDCLSDYKVQNKELFLWNYILYFFRPSPFSQVLSFLFVSSFIIGNVYYESHSFLF